MCLRKLIIKLRQFYSILTGLWVTRKLRDIVCSFSSLRSPLPLQYSKTFNISTAAILQLLILFEKDTFFVPRLCNRIHLKCSRVICRATVTWPVPGSSQQPYPTANSSSTCRIRNRRYSTTSWTGRKWLLFGSLSRDTASRPPFFSDQLTSWNISFRFSLSSRVIITYCTLDQLTSWNIYFRSCQSSRVMVYNLHSWSADELEHLIQILPKL